MPTVFDFREQQRRSRRGTVLLVLGFLVMATLIAIGIGIVAAYAVVIADQAGNPEAEIVVFAAIVVLAVIILAATIRILMLGGDGARVAKSFGGVEITGDATNPYLKRYLNIVDEMAIAAGLPRPRVFVLKNEKGINAFAAGSDPNRAAIAVTHGALSKLNRAELSGVVAHEMAHVGNYDTRLNVRLMGLVFGLVVLYVVGRGLVRSMAFSRDRRDGRTAGIAAIVGIGLIVLGSLGVLGGRILQAAVSRRREYLADATGVQFTRDPAGLANALKKIGGTSEGSKVASSHAEEARHMFFANALGFSGLFATHPALGSRIRALDPGFDPDTDPVWAMGEKEAMRDARADLAIGPWQGDEVEVGPADK